MGRTRVVILLAALLALLLVWRWNSTRRERAATTTTTDGGASSVTTPVTATPSADAGAEGAGALSRLDDRTPTKRRRPRCSYAPRFRVVPRKPMTREMLLEAMSYMGNFVVDGIDLSGVKLRKQEHTGWEFKDANLTGADLAGGDFGGVAFGNTKLDRANMTRIKAGAMVVRNGSTLDHADLSHADLRCADFDDVSLANTNFTNATLDGVSFIRAKDLDKAKLDGARLRYAFYGADAKFPAGVDPVARGAILVGPRSNLSGLVVPNRNFSALDLSDSDMKDMTVYGADFSSTKLARADLRGTDLTKAKLGDSAHCAQFADTILPNGTTWTGCGADLTNEQKTPRVIGRPAGAMPPRIETPRAASPCREPLERPDGGKRAKAKAAELVARYEKGERDFSNLDLEGSDFPKGAVMKGADLSFTRWDQSVAEGIDLSGASLRRARFLQSTLDGANLRNASLRFAALVEVHLVGADLTGADLTCAAFEMTELDGATLKQANLTAVDLRHAANLFTADLEGAILRGALYDDDTDFPEGVDPVRAGCQKLGRGANMRGLDLRGRSMIGDFDEADLQDADLEGANMISATLRRADLRGANIKRTEFATQYSPTDQRNCTRFEETIMPDGERWTGCGNQLPMKYRVR